jgi:hypothetical protein
MKEPLNIPDCIGPLPQYFFDKWRGGISELSHGFDHTPDGLPGHFTALAIYLRHRTKPEMRHLYTFVLN